MTFDPVRPGVVRSGVAFLVLCLAFGAAWASAVPVAETADGETVLRMGEGPAFHRTAATVTGLRSVPVPDPAPYPATSSYTMFGMLFATTYELVTMVTPMA